jgi:hypothetical protein
VAEWTHIVHAQLAALGLDAEREDEIRAELSDHLDEAYADARRRGLSDEDAMRQALTCVPDWTDLARRLRRAHRKDRMLSRDARVLWVPGMTALAAAAAITLATTLLPSSLWTAAGRMAPAAVMSVWAAAYVGLGALAAAWSWRAGGSRAARIGAGLLPLALHLAMIVTAIVVDNQRNARIHPQHGVNLQLGVVFAFVVIPGVALTLGTMPFWRERVSADRQY